MRGRGSPLALAMAVRRQTAPRRRGRPRKSPRVAPSHGIVLDYFKVARHNLDLAKALVTEMLLPELASLVSAARQHTDAVRSDAGGYVDRLNALLERMRKTLNKAALTDEQLAAQVQTYFGKTDAHVAAGVRAQIKAVLGLDVISSVPNIAETAQTFVKQNVALIKSVPESYLADIEQRTLAAFRTGMRAEDLATELADRYDIAQNRAALIARDQIGKLTGELVEDRQRSLGIDSYVWSTSKDERVREEHAVRDGETFRYDDPPEDGNPGQAINCRCAALPVLDDLL